MRFAVTAVDLQRHVVSVEVDADDEVGAREVARQRGYTVLSIARSAFQLGRRKPRRFQSTLFSIELLALLDAGLNVVEALQALEEKARTGEARRIPAELLAALRRGEPLSGAVSRFPEAFSPLFIATIQASERTGDLKLALSRHIAYAEEVDKVRKRVAATLLYPAILVGVGTLVMAFLMFYVVPRFARVYDDISTSLPFFSSVLFAVGGWIGRNSALTISATLTSVAGLIYALSRESVRANLLASICKVPAIGERMRVYQLSRLYRTVGMLLRAGIPASSSLRMVSGLLAPNLRPQLERTVALLSEGRAMSVALGTTGLTTPVAARMLSVGERGGNMGEMMERIARFLDEETARFVDAFTRVFEPVLMAVLGVAVGLVVVFMYMPIFELAGSIR